MSELNDKYFGTATIISIAKEKNIPVIYHDEFIHAFEVILQEMKNHVNEFEEEDWKEYPLNFALTYIDFYIKEIQKGHSTEWARKYSLERYDNSDHDYVFFNTYDAIRKINPELALAELKAHCESVKADKLFTNYFISLMESREGLKDPNKKAAIYSGCYTDIIKEGKSEVFAHKYADFMAFDLYGEIYCYHYARIYDDAIKKGQSVTFANSVAKDIAEYHERRIPRHEAYNHDKDDMKQYNYNLDIKGGIIGEDKGVEFAIIHQLQNRNKFTDIFKKEYFKSYRVNAEKPDFNEDEFDKMIFEKAMEKYNSI